MNAEIEYIGRSSFIVENFQEDITGRLQWHELGFALLRSAKDHAESHGFGYGPKSGAGITWVLLRFSIEMYERPQQGERYEVLTWADSMQRVCLTRLYEIRSSEGRIIGRAHSVWTLLDLQTRNMAVLNSERQAHLEERLAPKPDFPMKGMGKVRVKSEECVCERPVYFSDLDVNGHLNSVRTMDMVLDLLPTQLHKDLAIKRIDIAYAKESMIGEHLQCFMQAIENGAQIELRKPTGETMVRAQVEWGNTKSL